MQITTIQDVATEPVTLAEIKAVLKIDPDYTSQDQYLLSLYVAVRERLEGLLNLSLGVKKLRLTWDGCRIELPYGPVTSVPDSEYYTYQNGWIWSDKGWGNYNYFYQLTGGAIIEPVNGNLADPVTVEYTTGYTVLPAGLKQGMLAMIDNIYHSRGTINDPLPDWVNGMVMRYSRNLVL